jgi:hypothetical protein
MSEPEPTIRGVIADVEGKQRVIEEAYELGDLSWGEWQSMKAGYGDVLAQLRALEARVERELSVRPLPFGDDLWVKRNVLVDVLGAEVAGDE